MNKEGTTTLYFYGLSNTSLWSNLMILNNRIFVILDFSFGASKISFLKKDKKTIGKAISKSVKNKRFRRVLNP